MGTRAAYFGRVAAVALIAASFASAQTPLAPGAGAPDPSWKVRSNVFLKRLVSLQAVYETIPGATFDQIRNFPREWQRTPTGYLKRNGSQYGQFVVGEAIEFGVSAFHREDPRYFRMPEATFGKRLGHALISGVRVRSADGTHNTIALARLANVYGSWAIATSWNPPSQRQFDKILFYGSAGMGLKTSVNIFREFWPDAKRKLFHR